MIILFPEILAKGHEITNVENFGEWGIGICAKINHITLINHVLFIHSGKKIYSNYCIFALGF
jgi:hypothetical protein